MGGLNVEPAIAHSLSQRPLRHAFHHTLVYVHVAVERNVAQQTHWSFLDSKHVTNSRGDEMVVSYCPEWSAENA